MAAALLALAAGIAAGQAAWAQPADARGLLERALGVIGRPAEMAAAGGLVFEAEGTRNQAAERQGRAPESFDPAPFREAMAFDPAGDRLAREYRYDRYDGTFEWLRDLYLGDEDRKILVLQDGFAVWLRSPRHAQERRRYQRRIPHVLLQELLSRPNGEPRMLGERDGKIQIEGALRDGTLVRVMLEPSSHLPARVEYRTDIQSWGDATVAWTFAEWTPLAGVGRFPGKIKAYVAGRPFLDLEVTRVETGARAVEAMFSPPEGITLPAQPQVLPASRDASARATVRREGAGVYTVRNLRPGFHPFFVELGECVLAVDAPAGYRLLEQLPAGDVADGPSSAWLSERYIELIRETLPEKRICWMALTHFHNDHAGGLRAFAAEGATLLVSPGDRRAVRALLENPHEIAPDRFSKAPGAVDIETVEERLRLTGGGRSVELLQTGVNPHSDEMLSVWLPEERFLFVSDLITPAPVEDFPTPSHAALDRSFLQWLDAAGLEPKRVYSMHGTGLASGEHLEKLRRQTPPRRLRTLVADHPVDAAVSQTPHVEPHLAAHPSDPAFLVAGSIVVAADRGQPWRCAAFVSKDGGGGWERRDFAMESCIDPWALVTPEGTILVSAIEIGRERPSDERFRLLLFGSENGGRDWSEGLELGAGHDHELMLREPDGRLLLVSRRAERTPEGKPRHSIELMQSTDGGGFSSLAKIRPSNLALNATGLARLSDGTLVVSFLDFQRNVDGFDVRGGLSQPRAWVVRSRDGGRTFSEPLFASEGCGASDGFAGYPALAADASRGPYRDRLYHLCVRAGFRGLALTTSDDGGETWSDPRRIDVPPADGPAHARTPMLAVNGEGVLAAAWYDRRRDGDRACQDLYMTASSDGGASFLPPVRVSTETSCPEVPGNGRVAQSWPMGGDYGSLAAAADGSFHVVWADSRSGRFQLRHASMRLVKSQANSGGDEE